MIKSKYNAENKIHRVIYFRNANLGHFTMYIFRKLFSPVKYMP